MSEEVINKESTINPEEWRPMKNPMVNFCSFDVGGCNVCSG